MTVTRGSRRGRRRTRRRRHEDQRHRARRDRRVPGRPDDRSPEPRPRGSGGGDRGDRARDGARPGDHGQVAARRARGRARHARAGERRRRHLGTRGHQLRRARVVGVRLPRRRRAFAAPPGDLQQRRQRRRALRPPATCSVPEANLRSSVSAIVGTGLGGGVIESGEVVRGASGMAGELGHVHIPMDGLLAGDQPVPRCNCGFVGDLESVASLSGIENNLLPYWLTRYPDHPLAAEESIRRGRQGGARLRRARRRDGAADLRAAGDGDRADVHDRRQLHRSRRLLRRWRRGRGGAALPRLVRRQGARAHLLREEQALVATIALVPDLDMAGARGSAMAALHAIRP